MGVTIRHDVAVAIVNSPNSTARDIGQSLKLPSVPVRKALEYWRDMNLAYSTREVGKGPTRRWSPEPALIELVKSGGVNARAAFFASESGEENPWMHPYRTGRAKVGAVQVAPLDYASPLLVTR